MTFFSSNVLLGLYTAVTAVTEQPTQEGTKLPDLMAGQIDYAPLIRI